MKQLHGMIHFKWSGPCITCLFNSLSPERYGGKFEYMLLQHDLMIAILSSSSEIAFRSQWIGDNFFEDKLSWFS